MKILVCIKQVPDTGTNININPDATGIVNTGMEYVINPFDEFALEAALLLKDADHNITVTVITAGPARCRRALTSALAAGADRGIFIETKEDRSYDSFFNANLVGETTIQEEFDLVLCGLQGADYNTGLFPVYLAQKLGLPLLTSIFSIDLAAGCRALEAVKLTPDGSQTLFEVKLPAVVSFARGKTALRYASLPEIIKARKKEITTVVSEEAVVSELRMPIQIRELYHSEQTRERVVIDGTDETAVNQLFDYLASDLKAFE